MSCYSDPQNKEEASTFMLHIKFWEFSISTFSSTFKLSTLTTLKSTVSHLYHVASSKLCKSGLISQLRNRLSSVDIWLSKYVYLYLRFQNGNRNMSPF